MRALKKRVALTGVVLAMLVGAGCQPTPEKGGRPAQGRAEKVRPEAAPRPADGSLPAAPDPQWPRIREGHYVKWVGRVWNTRKRARIREAGGVGTLGQRNGTGTYLGEATVNGGSVELDVKFDAGYLAPKGGGKHFLEIMSWMADRGDREAIGAGPWSRIELANLGDRPRCLVWNYGPHFRGRATEIFAIGPAFKPDRWYHIRLALWRARRSCHDRRRWPLLLGRIPIRPRDGWPGPVLPVRARRDDTARGVSALPELQSHDAGMRRTTAGAPTERG